MGLHVKAEPEIAASKRYLKTNFTMGLLGLQMELRNIVR